MKDLIAKLGAISESIGTTLLHFTSHDVVVEVRIVEAPEIPEREDGLSLPGTRIKERESLVASPRWYQNRGNAG